MQDISVNLLLSATGWERKYQRLQARSRLPPFSRSEGDKTFQKLASGIIFLCYIFLIPNDLYSTLLIKSRHEPKHSMLDPPCLGKCCLICCCSSQKLIIRFLRRVFMFKCGLKLRNHPQKAPTPGQTPFIEDLLYTSIVRDGFLRSRGYNSIC